LCGLCLALRDDYGQSARIATNYHGLVVSLLVEAQAVASPTRRTAGPCPLRGMRRADVATGECVRLAAVVSLALAGVEFTDGRLPHRLLTRELRRAVSRTFSRAGYTAQSGTPRGCLEPSLIQGSALTTCRAC
jgi:hypothetical protein